MLGGARALLHLIEFDEPFGFSVVEAMACGTPVVAFRRGSMPELIERRRHRLPRRRRRRRRSPRWETASSTAPRSGPWPWRGSARRMVDEYLDAYEQLIA